MIAGKARNARAKPSIAKAFFPGVFGTSESMARAIRVSQHPPPGIVRVSRTEGIIPALETSHAFAQLEKLMPTLKKGQKVVLNCSGRGDKDVNTAAAALDISGEVDI